MTSTNFGGIGYRSRRDMIAGACGDWLYGGAGVHNTDDQVRELIDGRGAEAIADEMASDGWLDEVRKSDDSVDRDDLVDGIFDVREDLRTQ